jgi:hypothetical protein
MTESRATVAEVPGAPMEGRLMSIYTSNRGHSPANDFAWDQVPQKGIERRPGAPPARDWTPQRRACPYDRLLPSSRVWLNSLPPSLRPIVLAVQYPRIVNLIAQQWDDAAACGAYLDDLLVGRRPDRRGFPDGVRQDILELREYFVRSRITAGGNSTMAEKPKA